MKKILRRIAVLLVVFVLGVTGTAFLLNSETTDDRSDMNDPTLPEVMVEIGSTLANRMYGYKQHMQVDFTRDSLTPLDTTKKIVFVVNPYETGVTSLSYEIRTSDGSKVIENRKIKNLTPSDQYLRAEAEITSALLMNQEYSMEITLDTEQGPVYYYTRVVSRSQLNTESYVQFVTSFYEKCMDKATADDLSSYLEPEETGSTVNYANISVKSKLSEVSWGRFAPQIYKRGIPIINEINETTASISLDYQISAKNESGQTEIYDVTEFYRMRFTEARIMLLDFERSAQQIFDPSLPVITDAGLVLGVRDKNVNFATNENASVVAFVQEGDLWTYAPKTGKIVRVFTFRRDNQSDFRDVRSRHDIKIIRVYEDGNVDFVLYGYMNRGAHEGYSGVCVYHYNADQNVLEEKVFIPSTESYDFLNEDLGTLSYVSADNCLFLLFARKLYQIDIDKGSFKILEEGILPENFVVSATNAHAAWLVSEGNHAGKIKEIDFDTLKTTLRVPQDEQQLRVLGFLNEDLVYGVLYNSDILTDANGHVTEGISTLRIEGFDGTIKKEYYQAGLYVTDVSVGETLMEFELSAKNGDTYVFQKKDNIMNNKKAQENQVAVELTSTSRTGVQVRLAFDEDPSTDEPLIILAKMRIAEEHIVELDTQVPQDEIYYVYAYGKLDSVWQDPAQAILRADARTGVVLNRAQQYVWERGNKRTQFQMNLEDVPAAFRTGSWDRQTLQDALGDQGTIIDLSGCTLDNVLYEVNAQRPVIAKTSANTCVVIIGYDEYNTYLYNPATSETYPYGINDSTALFESAGNIFISYTENVMY